MKREASPSGATRIYNLVSMVMVALTALTLCGVIGFAAFGPKASASGGGEPTLFVIGSPTATLKYPTPQASFTPSESPTATVTGTVTRTPIPSETGTPTNTPTATNTLTPSPSATATATTVPSPTATRAAFDFVLKNGQIIFGKYYNLIDLTKKSADPNDCGARLAGAVFDKNNAYLGNMRVHIVGPGLDERQTAGSHPEYGSSGWEQYITNVSVERTYTVQLEYSDGALASEAVTVTTNKDCNLATAIVNFQQIQSR